MKRIIFFTVLVLLFRPGAILAQSATPLESISTSGCLINGDFDQYCGNTVNIFGCPTFDAGCVPNWTRSHGTPQIMTPGPAATDNLAYMWYAGSQSGGEGIFASYTFQRFQPYSVRVRLNAPGTTGGSIFIYAANSMTQGALTNCGDPIPSVPSKSLIAQINEFNVGWKEYTFSFTPSDNTYSQLWIYPFTTSSAQFDLYVDYIFPCPDTCNGTVYYNNGVVPSGVTRAGNIFTGSSAGSGGSGLVTVSPTASTDLVASNQIQWLPDFNATVSSGSFVSEIVPCNGLAARLANRPNTDVSRLYTRQDSISMAALHTALAGNKALSIYPNPVKDKLTIDLTAVSENRVTISIVNIQGQVVRTIPITKPVYNAIARYEYDVSGLPQGIYFIKATGRQFSSVIKFEKMQ
jgi:hypothetical protein